MIVATLLWEPNERSFDFSRCYDESWVEKLYRGFRRNLSQPFSFVCFTDRLRTFREPIAQELIRTSPPDYRACIEPYGLGLPMILVGLDTVVVGNCDHLARYCLDADRLAVPRDPFHTDTVCNGVALVPAGHSRIASIPDDETSDMDWIRKQDPAVLDDLFPGEVVSYKGHAMDYGISGVAIVYFHGARKPHEISDPWVREHWR